jgi:hypothetical protein
MSNFSINRSNILQTFNPVMISKGSIFILLGIVILGVVTACVKSPPSTIVNKNVAPPPKINEVNNPNINQWQQYIRSGQLFLVIFDQTKDKFDDSLFTGDWHTDPMGSLQGGETYRLRYIHRRECSTICQADFYEYGFETTGREPDSTRLYTSSYFNANLDKNEVSLWGRIYKFSPQGQVFDPQYGLVGHLIRIN